MFTNSISSVPKKNIYENQYTQFSLILEDDQTKKNTLNNYYIDKYYKHVNKVIKISDLFNKYVKCNGVHTITSEEEFNFFKDIDGVPLTKKYYYTIDTKTNIRHINNMNIVTVSLNVYNLIYNDFLKNNLFNNVYLLNSSYITTLSLLDTITIDFIFRDSEFESIDSFTAFVNSSKFDTDLLGHMNCILFNDIIIWDMVNNDSTVNIIANEAFDNKFIIKFNDTDYYIEDDLDNYSYEIINNRDSTIINNIRLNISKIPLYENIIYIKTVYSNSVKYEMCMVDRLIPITNEYLQTDYNTLIVGNKYFFETYNLQASQKFSNKQNIATAKLYTDDFYNNLYQVEVVEGTTGFINVYTLINGQPAIIKKYPYKTTEEKFKITAILPHSACLHLVKNIKPDTIFKEYVFQESVSSDVTAIFDKGSKIIDIQTTTNYEEYESNGDVLHTNLDQYDVPKQEPDSTVTRTYGSCFSDLKFFGGGKSLPGMKGNLLVPCYEGFARPVGAETQQQSVPQYNHHIYRTMNNMNMSNYLLTNLNNKANEFTLVFLTNKYGYLNNYMKFGDFWENVYGKIIICKDTTQSLNDMIYHVPIADQDSGYDSLLHIITHQDNHVVYEAQSDTTLYCSLDMTTDITKCNLSTFNIIGHKKTDNWTTRAEAGSTIPTRREVSQYRNMVTVSDQTGGRVAVKLMDVRYPSFKQKLSPVQLSHWAYGDDVPETREWYETWPSDQYIVCEFIAPSNYLKIEAYLGTPNNRYRYLQSPLYKGSYPENFKQDTIAHRSYGVEEDTNEYFENVTYFNDVGYFYHTIPGEKYYTVVIPNNNANYSGNSGFLEYTAADLIYLELTDQTTSRNFIPFVEIEPSWPLGYDQFKEDRGYNEYRNKTEEYMSIGLQHIYNQKLSSQRLNKIKQCYQNNRTNNTALLLK